jgi:hypothetical protein
MPITPNATGLTPSATGLVLNARRPLLLALAAAAIAGWMTGCATGRFDAAPPTSVNLTGEWRLNLNLSDDPDKMPDPGKDSSKTPGNGSHRGRGGGRGGPGGSGGPGPYGAGGAGTGFSAEPGEAVAESEETVPSPPAGSTSSATSRPGGATSPTQMLQPRVYLSIAQSGAKVVIRSILPDGTKLSDEYTSGSDITIPFGDLTAEQSAGWRGPVFVVVIKPKKGISKEDNYALDDDGRLIVTTQFKGGHVSKAEIKRVYDRLKA